MMAKTNELGRAKQMLFVDDDRLVLTTIASGLTAAGYVVVTAESAEEAEGLLAEGWRPDLAILDVHMPGRGGLYLAQRLGKLDQIPFIILSAYSSIDVVAQANDCGAMGYAVKPLDVHQLIPAIEAALRRADEFAGLRQIRQELQKALDDERDISVATGVFMAQKKLARRDAFAILRDAARKQRRKLAVLAGEVVAEHERSLSVPRSLK